MNASYRIVSAANGKVSVGAEVENLTLQGAGVTIPAVMVGEEGRGRERGVVPVANPPMIPCPNRGQGVYGWGIRDKCPTCGEGLVGVVNRNNHPDAGDTPGRLLAASIGQTRAGKPKFVAAEQATTDEKIIVVLRTPIGFRGSNAHTGDRAGWDCTAPGCRASGPETNLPKVCPACGAAEDHWSGGPESVFSPFPGEIIAQGRIAQGDAGRAGSGRQIIALVPKNTVFRTEYTGRLYGGPAAHYYVWTGEKILAATWTERATADLF